MADERAEADAPSRVAEAWEIQLEVVKRRQRGVAMNAAKLRVRELAALVFAEEGRVRAGLGARSRAAGCVVYEVGEIATAALCACAHVGTREARQQARQVLDALDALEDAAEAVYGQGA